MRFLVDSLLLLEKFTLSLKQCDFRDGNCNVNRICTHLFQRKPCIFWFCKVKNFDQRLELSVTQLHEQNGSDFSMDNIPWKCSFCIVQPCDCEN